MRILAIRGENLASLAETFEIDFAAAPLAAAGLFAITGETGAGKSTLLDALCLALYDEFPRVKAEGANEQIPDGENAPLAATDPRTILRRGAGRGFAEVDFSARDSVVYRVRCELARARGKATGALQKRGRALWKVLPEGVTEAVASGVVPVRQEVERLTDLTCDQFRRTVLLAQGDFDAFLRADAKERAELLEKITGTEIYATLSRRAFERWRATKQAVDALCARRDGIGLLSPEERAARANAIDDLTQRKARTNAAREALDAVLRRHEAIAAATARRDAASKTVETAQGACDALAEERARYAALERAEPLRSGSERTAEAQRGVAEAQAALETARGEDQAARAALGSAEAAETEAKARAEAAQAACEGFEPLWVRAQTLDDRIVDARALVAKRAGARDTAEAEAARRATAAEAIEMRLATSETEAGALDETLARDADLAPLATRFDELSEALEKRAGFVRETAELERKRDAAAATLDRLAATLAALDAADAADVASRAACAERLATHEAAFAAMDLPAMQARAQALEAADGIAARLAAAAKEAAAAAASQASARTRRDAAASAWKSARDDERGAEATLAELATRAEEVERLGALADATASESARRLRAALVPGEPCPVCGVPHDEKPDSAPDAFVAAIRARRDSLRAEQDAARAALAQARAAAEAAQAEGSRAREAMDVEAARLGEAARAFADAHAAWRALPALDLREPPENVVEAASALAALAEEIARARGAVRESQRRAEALRTEIERERTARDRAASAIEARRNERAGHDRDAGAARETVAHAATRLRDLADRRASIDRAWSRVLAASGITPGDLDRDPTGALRILETRAGDYRARAARREALREAIAADRVAAAAARTSAEGAHEIAAGASAAVTEAEGALSGLVAERGGLLDGEATEAHRTRHRADAATAREAFEKARAACEAARSRVAVAAASLRTGEVALARAAEHRTAAGDAFAAACTTACIAPADAIALLAVPRAERDALRARLAAADEGLREARSALGHCESALAEAIGEGAPEQDAEAAGEHRAALLAEIAELDETLVAARVALEQDDRAREQAGRLEDEIAAAGADELLWREVSDAIGSADGSKFRRYAQSVTLDHLVALANRHLDALAPRYRLERAGGETGTGGGDLGLQILDRELGDARRSTRSLSGGERFLTSLALALALCSLEGRGSFVDTLFIDEGFGTLDAATLDVAIDALETLQAQGRKVGVISHVEAMHQRIPVQIRVEKAGGGRSRVRVTGAGLAQPAIG
ncbi:AAA family ATPase [Salinarimonas ramus]|uniref:Rad50/SbcC-type AAA domain-containing protein n=1 Tax=Salinarimonas ramus TaxID=690164 RepID=A0A917Q5E5_9HYPH|nr:AAA family ATPase [Salinarimonas ramus]GGK28827.1 hypothetical protein GCM10011322_14030 [Salinarimonas ramus]